MDLRRAFENFAPTKALVFLMLLIFTITLSLRLDGTIEWSYWVIFLPLWIWKLTVLFGFFAGVIIWARNPQYRSESRVEFKAMVISSASQLLLCLFEILACDTFETSRIRWVFVFVPLLVMCVSGVGICIWAAKSQRSFDLEFLITANILFFIFLLLRLDRVVLWSWSVVFIPVWIAMSAAIVVVIYGLILALILWRSPEIMPEQRGNSLCLALGYVCVVFPMLVFEILLVQKLDKEIDTSFVLVCLPLIWSLIVLICMSFTSRAPSNRWWFGVRKDFCQFFLEACPFLQEYGNISYKIGRANRSDSLSVGNVIQVDATGFARTNERLIARDMIPGVGGDTVCLSQPHFCAIDVPD